MLKAGLLEDIEYGLYDKLARHVLRKFKWDTDPFIG